MEIPPVSFNFGEVTAQNARMKVVGVGGGGSNSLDRMITAQLEGVEFIAVDTDVGELKNSKADVKIQIGKVLTHGLGSSSRPELGRAAVEENLDDIKVVLQNADLVFVTCGMGGGTGTGAAPLVCQTARQSGALTVGIVTRPFLFEGRKRMRQAEEGIAEMRRHVDTVVVIPIQKLLADAGNAIPFHEALKLADGIVMQAIQAISVLISETGLVNIDFADVRTIMTNGGSAVIGTGSAHGVNRASVAARRAVSSSLLEVESILGANGVLVNIVGGEDLTLEEVHTINDIVHETVGSSSEIIYGAVHEPSLAGEIRVTLIATGFANQDPYSVSLETTRVELAPLISSQSESVHYEKLIESDSRDPAILIAWSPATVDPTRYAEVVEILGDLVRLEGGGGVSRIGSQGLEGTPSRRRISA